MTEQPDWSAPAEVFAGTMAFGSRGARYFRFPTMAAAIRFAIEDLPSASLRGTVIETGEFRFEGQQIRSLYDGSDYPLQRHGR